MSDGSKEDFKLKNMKNWSCAVGYGLGSGSPLSPSFNFCLELANSSQVWNLLSTVHLIFLFWFFLGLMVRCWSFCHYNIGKIFEQPICVFLCFILLLFFFSCNIWGGGGSIKLKERSELEIYIEVKACWDLRCTFNGVSNSFFFFFFFF